VNKTYRHELFITFFVLFEDEYQCYVLHGTVSETENVNLLHF
jgi:hypothetical protein